MSSNSVAQEQDQQSDSILLGEATRILEVAEVTTRRLSDTGALECVRVGPHRLRLFRRSDVERLAAERRNRRRAQ